MGFNSEIKVDYWPNAYEGIWGKLMDIGTVPLWYWAVIEIKIRECLSRQKGKYSMCDSFLRKGFSIEAHWLGLDGKRWP